MCSVRLMATAENTPTPTPEPAAAWPGTPLEAAGQIALIALPSICGSLALPTHRLAQWHRLLARGSKRLHEQPLDERTRAEKARPFG